MSDPEQPTTVYDDPDVAWYDDEADVGAADGPLPRRPRRRLLTPATGALAAVVLVAGSFIGGVEVQKHQGGGGAGGGRAGLAALYGQGRAGAQGTAPGGVGARGGAGANATVGTVANVKGSTLYVTGAGGTTVKVRAEANAKITRNATADVGGVHPGDTVIVQGTTASSGTVKATSITATAKGAAGAAFAAFGRFGRGSGGASSGGGGSSVQMPQGFAPPAG